MDLERYKENERRRLASMMRDAGVPAEDRRERLQQLRDTQASYDFVVHNVLTTFPAECWAEPETDAEAAPVQLLGDLWKEGELAVLFGPSGVGKSIFAVHLAEMLASGRALDPFPAAPARRVLYVDLEAGGPQFARRYTRQVGETMVRYEFSEGFLRSEVEWDEPLPPGCASMDDLLFDSIVRTLTDHRCRTVIIDSLPHIGTGPRSAGAVGFVKKLKSLVAAGGVSVLLIAGSRERGYAHRVGVPDLAAPGTLKTFADGIFAIAPSRRVPGTLYLKRLKSRSSVPAADGVVETFQIRTRPSAAALLCNVEPAQIADAAPATPAGQVERRPAALNIELEPAPPLAHFPAFHHLGRSTEDHEVHPPHFMPDIAARGRHLAATGLPLHLIALVLQISPADLDRALNSAPPKLIEHIDITPE